MWNMKMSGTVQFLGLSVAIVLLVFMLLFFLFFFFVCLFVFFVCKDLQTVGRRSVIRTSRPALSSWTTDSVLPMLKSLRSPVRWGFKIFSLTQLLDGLPKDFMPHLPIHKYTTYLHKSAFQMLAKSVVLLRAERRNWTAMGYSIK